MTPRSDRLPPRDSSAVDLADDDPHELAAIPTCPWLAQSRGVNLARSVRVERVYRFASNRDVPPLFQGTVGAIDTERHVVQPVGKLRQRTGGAGPKVDRITDDGEIDRHQFLAAVGADEGNSAHAAAHQQRQANVRRYCSDRTARFVGVELSTFAHLRLLIRPLPELGLKVTTARCWSTATQPCKGERDVNNIKSEQDPNTTGRR